VFLNDLFGYPKAEAGSGRCLGCKKWLEDARESAGFYTLSSVRHRNPDYWLAALSAS
jgi:hypothetical protein